MKNNNTIFLVIGIILIGVIFYSPQPEEMMVIHYYKDGVEVFPQRGLFSIIDGTSYNQISFDIYASNIGDVDINNMQIVSASPSSFYESFSKTNQSLAKGQTSKLLWSSSLMDTAQFESTSPTLFSVTVSGESNLGPYQAVASESILIETELCADGVGINNRDGTCTITLQEADTENLDDAFVAEHSPDYSFGHQYALYLGRLIGYSDKFARIYIKFDISSVSDFNIVSSSLDLSAGGGQDYTATPIKIHQVNVPWDESTITWNNQPCGVNFDNSVNCNLVVEDETMVGFGHSYWDVTNLINGDPIVSFVLLSDEELENKQTIFNSKSADTIRRRPKLEITYIGEQEEPPVQQIQDAEVSASIIEGSCSSCSYGYDENWDTYTYSTTSGHTVIHEDYSYPIGAENIKIKIKSNDLGGLLYMACLDSSESPILLGMSSSGIEISIFDVPSSCLLGNIVIIRNDMFGGINSVHYYESALLYT